MSMPNKRPESDPKQVYELLLGCALFEQPFEDILPYFSSEFMGYGTAGDELLRGRQGFRDMITRQREQAPVSSINIARRPIYEELIANGKGFLFAEEFDIVLLDGTSGFTMRLSVIMEWKSGGWIINHFHSSVPDHLAPEGESWPMEAMKKRNLELEALVKERTRQLEESLEKLKATQDQLIHSEKMASLGELTAGIAHEIKNPLNFVNNFAEVSTELITELHEELDKGDLQEVRDISSDLLQNLEKINHHGQRADSIVKNMLLHTRSGAAEKQATDINALVDEYFKLAYHGLRAKDNTFNAEMSTDYDASLKALDVVTQDIGRVLLNLMTNSFQAVHARRLQNEDGYVPKVSVRTSLRGDHIIISVEDNGTGISEEIRDKIFQPFFTTKPTGQGTGLGLSISFDIIKAHGGHITIESSEEIGTKFNINLPLSS